MQLQLTCVVDQQHEAREAQKYKLIQLLTEDGDPASANWSDQELGFDVDESIVRRAPGDVAGDRLWIPDRPSKYEQAVKKGKKLYSMTKCPNAPQSSYHRDDLSAFGWDDKRKRPQAVQKSIQKPLLSDPKNVAGGLGCPKAEYNDPVEPAQVDWKHASPATKGGKSFNVSRNVLIQPEDRALTWNSIMPSQQALTSTVSIIRNTA